MRTFRGDLLGYNLKETTTNMAIDPAGRMVAAGAVDKKGEHKPVMYSTVDAQRTIFKYPVKKYGEPNAVCFSADGRSMMVATSKGIHIFSLPKFELVSTMVAPSFSVLEMTVSDNGQFMLARGEEKVYLLHNHSPYRPLLRVRNSQELN